MLAATPATAVADTHYGGSAVRKGALAGPAMSVVVSDDGRVVARLAMGHRCRGFATSTLVVRLSGRTNGRPSRRPAALGCAPASCARG